MKGWRLHSPRTRVRSTFFVPFTYSITTSFVICIFSGGRQYEISPTLRRIRQNPHRSFNLPDRTSAGLTLPSTETGLVDTAGNHRRPKNMRRREGGRALPHDGEGPVWRAEVRVCTVPSGMGDDGSSRRTGR